MTVAIILIAYCLHSAIFIFDIASAFKHFCINKQFGRFDCDAVRNFQRCGSTHFYLKRTIGAQNDLVAASVVKRGIAGFKPAYTVRGICNW